LEEVFDAERFIRGNLSEINSAVGGERILLACSGGVCSNVMATLVLKATGESKINSLFVDTGFMRENEVERVSEILTRAPLKLDLKVMNARKQFMRSVERAETSIQKKKMFYEVFNGILRDFAAEQKAGVIIMGTAATGRAPEIPSESPRSKPNSKSNPLLLEPLIDLNRGQVLDVARKLELPPRLTDANPFPAPGLMIRVAGKVNDDKIKEVKQATNIVEEELQYVKPSQYFAAIIEERDEVEPKIEKIKERISDLLDVGTSQVEVKVPQSRVAGLEDGRSVDQKALAIRVTLLKSKELLEPDYESLTELSAELKHRHKDFTRFFYSVTEKPKNGKYMAIIRAVETEDFTKARIARLDFGKLRSIATRIMNESGKISSVYYDLTSNPPAMIEVE
jgi:GMP synthase (glutamine-hydrolysing)